jgi:hypothetical protein
MNGPGDWDPNKVAEESKEKMRQIESGKMFAEWAKKAKGAKRGEISNINKFNDFLEQDFGAHASVIYRDRKVASQRFEESVPAGIQYWMVSKDGRYFLFPRPLDGDRFEEVSPLFGRNYRPGDEVVPVEMKRSEHEYVPINKSKRAQEGVRGSHEKTTEDLKSRLAEIEKEMEKMKREVKTIREELDKRLKG